jgi:hypothetical protein
MDRGSILQIVSGFKPAVDGMGDFSRRLGDALWKLHGIRSHYLVFKRPASPLNPDEIAPNTLSYFDAQTPPRACLEQIAELRRDVRRDEAIHSALLHYGPYGYSREGKPGEFVDAMEELSKSLRMLIFFHEMSSSGPPWKRAFWTRGEQVRSLEKLLKIADAAFTSNRKYYERLERMNAAHRPLVQIPIFSNIGEPQKLATLEKRTRQLVIFGPIATRIRLYRDRRQELEKIVRLLRVTKIVDVGPGASAVIPVVLAGVELRSMGFMEEQALSDLLADSVAGILGYWPDVWEKSGVMAAYEAHALLPILVELEPRLLPEPAYVPYLTAERLERLADADGVVSNDRLQNAVDAAYAYYRGNQSVERCAEQIAQAAMRV